MGYKRDTYGAKFYNRDDSLTMYSLACGYIEKTDVTHGKDYIQLTLEKDGACYHVKLSSNVDGFKRIWESFDTLTEARAFFKANRKHVALRMN
jgi:hypothetical protein